MLAVCVILLAAVPYYAYGQENSFECYKKLNEECSRDGIPREFPDTVSKLQEACREITEYLSCSLNVREECDPLGNTTRSLREVYEYVRLTCDEDSSIYNVLSKNVQCLASSVERVESLCNKMPNAGKLEFFRENAESHVGNMDSLTSRDLYCLDTIMSVTCGSLVAGTRCGDEVEDVIFDMTDKLQGQLGPCSPELSALKGTLRAAFRDAFIAKESFMNRIGDYSGNSD